MFATAKISWHELCTLKFDPANRSTPLVIAMNTAILSTLPFIMALVAFAIAWHAKNQLWKTLVFLLAVIPSFLLLAILVLSAIATTEGSQL